MQIHELKGCSPTPLAHYLKALGILRLVAEQKDPEARAWWEGDRFFLATHLDESELLTFFLDEYEPTPMVAPWNKGSGFYYEEDVGLSPIEKSEAPRFQKLRTGIIESRAQLGELSAADRTVRQIKDETKKKGMSASEKKNLKTSSAYKERLAVAERTFKNLKADFIPLLRSSWRGPHREWLDAAMVINDGKDPQFPALLGTGGNDGRLDFTNNFFQNLNRIYDFENPKGRAKSEAAPWISNSLWNTIVDSYIPVGAIGQYSPSAIGGANSTTGPDGLSSLNPVDLVFLLEGAILFTAHATRRLNSQDASRAAAPFVVNARGAGYASAGTNDEGARGEQWMPLWGQPLTLKELKHLLAEGRAAIGRRSVHDSLDMARAVANLGTARGITSFQRYGYIERNGQSNLAVPLGRYRVPERIAPLLSCLDDLDRWLHQLKREARGKNAPIRLQTGERLLSNHLFAITEHPAEPSRWQNAILAMAQVEAILLSSQKYKTGPIPRLRPDWVSVGNDGSPEWRLALAFALQARSFRGVRLPLDPIRRHWVPEKNLEVAAVMKGRRGVDDASALVQRRLTEASQNGKRLLPLQAAPHAGTTISDLSGLLSGHVDLDRTLAFARVLMALDAYAWARYSFNRSAESTLNWPDDSWIAIRLAVLPWPLRTGLVIPNDPAIIRRLLSGDAATAVDIALRRLKAVGIRATIRFGTVPPETARLWAAALAFPINRALAERLVHRLDPYSNP